VKDCDSDQERLDAHNGLLLAAHLDAAFDGGLITVRDHGAVVVAAALDADAREVLSAMLRTPSGPCWTAVSKKIAMDRSVITLSDPTTASAACMCWSVRARWSWARWKARWLPAWRKREAHGSCHR
jgi:hypothetical protein